MPITPVDNTVRTQQTSTTASPPMRRAATTQTTQEPSDLKFLKPKTSTNSVSSIKSDLASLKSDFTAGAASTDNVIDRISGLVESLSKTIAALAGGTAVASTTTTASRTASTTPAATASTSKKKDKTSLLTSLLPMLLGSLNKPAPAPAPVLANPFMANQSANANPLQSIFSFNNNTSAFTGLFGGSGSGLFGIGDIFNRMVSDPLYTQGRGKSANAASAAAALGTPNALTGILNSIKSGTVGQ